MSARGNGHDANGRTAPAPSSGGDDELELLTPEDIATLFKVPVTWVRSQTRPRAKTPMPHIKVGAYTRFHESEVREWLQTRKRSYAPQPAKSRRQ